MDDREEMGLDESQDRSLTPALKMTRRMALAGGGIGAGYALLVQPVSAATIATDADGLTAGMVEVKAADRNIPAYRAHPAGKTNAPVVLVVHEVFGLHEHIKDLCRRLAKAGYYAISPDLYVRYGDATKVTDIQALLKDIVGKTNDAEIKSDLDAAVVFAKADKANTSKLAVTGFCWGGRVVWKYTAMTPVVSAGAAWYGPLGAMPAPSPVMLADKIKGRVTGFYGGKDMGIPEADRQAMLDALKAAGDAKSSINVYPNSPHGFNADYRPSYVEVDAKDAWGKMLAWFKAHGVA
jgi:carboxymethylenebutenolidase